MYREMTIEELQEMIGSKQGELLEINKSVNTYKSKKEELLVEIDKKIGSASITEDELVELQGNVEDVVNKYQESKTQAEVVQSELSSLEGQLKSVEVVEETEDLSKQNNIIKGSESKMDKIKKEASVLKGYITEQAKNFTGKVTDEIKKEFITAEDNRVIIPDNITYLQEHEEIVDLRQFVNVVPVSSSSGTTWTSSRTRTGLQPKQENGEFPVLQGLLNEDKQYKTQAFGGVFTISHEIIKDAAFDVERFYGVELQAEKLVTYNNAILNVFNGLGNMVVTNSDELKVALQSKIPVKYGKKILLVTASGYDKLSLLKYQDGHYKYDPDVNSESNFLLHGVQVIKVDDEVLGNPGEEFGFLITKSTVDLFTYEDFGLTFLEKITLGLKCATYVRFGATMNKLDSGVKIFLNFNEGEVDPDFPGDEGTGDPNAPEVDPEEPVEP